MCVLDQPLSPWGQSEALRGMLNFGSCKGHFLGAGVVCVNYFFFWYFYPSFAFDHSSFFLGLHCFEGELISLYEMVALHPKKGWILDSKVCSVFHNKSSIRSPVNVDHREASELHLNWVASSSQTFVAFYLCNKLSVQNTCFSIQMWWACSCTDLSNTDGCLRGITQGPASPASTHLVGFALLVLGSVNPKGIRRALRFQCIVAHQLQNPIKEVQ